MDEPDEDEGAAFPLAVTIAGWLWVVQGAVCLVCSGLAFLVMLGAGNCFSLVVCMGGLLFGMLLLQRGRGTIHRVSRDVIWPALAALLIGTLALIVVMLASIDLSFAILFLAGPPFLLLMSSGLLALYGRGAYLRWRREKARRDEDARAGDEPQT
jgi:hypothetical protein